MYTVRVREPADSGTGFAKYAGDPATFGEEMGETDQARAVRSFYRMRNSLFCFDTRLEYRFTRAEISGMLKRCGFTQPEFVNNEQYWCGLAYRS